MILVDPEGIEPSLMQCECIVLPLNYGPEEINFVDPRGIEPLIFSMPWRRHTGRPRAHALDYTKN